MDREIFTYWDGKRHVKCDPMRIEIAFRNSCKKVDIDELQSKFCGPEWLGNPDKIKEEGITKDQIKFAVERQDEATIELIPIICETFGFKDVMNDEENGLTWGEILAAFNAWQDFYNKVKKNTNLNAESPPPLEVQSQQMITKDNLDGTGIPTSPPGFVPSQS